VAHAFNLAFPPIVTIKDKASFLLAIQEGVPSLVRFNDWLLLQLPRVQRSAHVLLLSDFQSLLAFGEADSEVG